MKTILAFIGGGDRDQIIMQTALAAAQPISAHLDFLHIHASPGMAARYSSAEFVSGPALRNALDQLAADGSTHSTLAAQHVQEFCSRSNIEMRDTPAKVSTVTASFREETDNALDRLTFHARHSDLIVIGRAMQTQGLAPNTIEHLILHCGRPLLVVTTAAPPVLGTIMVCWTETANSARAVAAASPILAHANRVVFVTVAEREGGPDNAIDDLARQFAWNGVTTEVKTLLANGRKVPAVLAAAAADCGADLVVMGAYGHSRARELIFGSCTEAFIGDADKPILLMH